MIIRKGDKFLCERTINNFFGWPLFEKGKEYEILHVDNESKNIRVFLNHNLYANEYMDYSLEWLRKNFKKIN